MKVIGWKIWVVSSLALYSVAGWAGQPDLQTAGREDDSAHLEAVFSRQDECYRSWNRLVTDWELRGGGFQESLVATRAQILADKKSEFARIVRGAWSAQSIDTRSSNQFGGWPVSETDFDAVVRVSNEGLTPLLNKLLPKGCGAFAWLYPVIWSHTKHVSGGSVNAKDFIEMSPKDRWDTYTEPRWVLYWLLIRISR